MPYSMAFSPDGSHLTITHHGLVTIEEFERARAEALPALAAANCLRLLVDLLQKETTVSKFDLYRLSASNLTTLPPLIRIALLYRPDQASEADYAADLAQRNGQDIRTFQDRQDALDWLLSRTSD